MGQTDSGHLVQVQPAVLEAANGYAMSKATGSTRGLSKPESLFVGSVDRIPEAARPEVCVCCLGHGVNEYECI